MKGYSTLRRCSVEKIEQNISEKLEEEIEELLKSGVKKSEIAVKYGTPYKILEKWKF